KHEPQFDPLAMTMRELTDGLIGKEPKCKALDLFFDDTGRRPFAVVACRSNPEIVAGRESVEDARHLSLNTDAEAGNLMGVQPRNILSTKKHRAACWLELTGKEFEERAFAGAVRPDEATQFPLGERKIDVTDRPDAAKILGQPARLNQRRAHALPFCATS